jgi:hypothetical protein
VSGSFANDALGVEREASGACSGWTVTARDRRRRLSGDLVETGSAMDSLETLLIKSDCTDVITRFAVAVNDWDLDACGAVRA